MAEVSGPRVLVTAIASGNLDFAEPASYRFVVKTGRFVNVAATSGGMIYGVLQNKPRNAEHAAVCVDGFTKISLGASLGPDIMIASNNTGFAILANSGQSTCGRLITGGNSGMPGELQFSFTGSGR